MAENERAGREEGADVFIAYGANLGDPRENIARALDALEKNSEIRIVARSSLYRTKPVGGPPGQNDFFNGVVRARTALEPYELLDALHDIENDLRRVRTVFWGPRTIDLDVLLYEDLIQDDPRLRLPHPRLCWRQFVLDPASEIAPDAIVPGIGLTFSELRALLWSTFRDFALTTRLRASLR